MDQHKLRSLVFEKTGVRVDIDDPIFALVALNEAVLAEAVERHVALIDAASQELVRHARAAGGLAQEASAATPRAYLDATNEAALGAVLPATATAAATTTAATAAATAAIVAAPGAGHVARLLPLTPREQRLLAAAAGISLLISLLSALLVLGGQALFFKPAPTLAPVVQLQAKPLTPEQTAAIATADKLTRAMQKLDPKSRSLLQAELQKP